MTNPEKNMVLDNRKLWIGNLDTRVTEYQLLKLVQSYGTIEKFDLIFHHSGPLAGQPRGYAFVTYAKSEDALGAKSALNGKLVGQKHLIVTCTQNPDAESSKQVKPKPDITIPALALTKDTKKTDRTSQIQAIEAKLKLMEHREDELKINDSIATKPPVIQQFQFNKDKSHNLKPKQSFRTHDRHKKPYIKKKVKN